ncbi:hypothetical protein ACIQVU_19625 [Lysinibacillus sp. NPDC098008]|uniref:hypothetical protein n=1 Tax=Lysinibacillus sp. NPDC098008 TaxID=3364146 RepID=UPI003810D131
MESKLSVVLLVLGLLLVGCSKQSNEAQFVIEEIATMPLENGKDYFIVTPIKWIGNDNVVINDITFINAEPTIHYQFYAGASDKKPDIYQCSKDELGELQSIQQWAIEKEATLILALQLNDVKKNPERQLKISYTLHEQQQEQIIDAGMIQNLHTVSQ